MKKFFNAFFIIVQLLIFAFSIYFIVPAFTGQMLGVIFTLPIILGLFGAVLIIAISFIVYSSITRNKPLLIYSVVILILTILAVAVLFLKLYKII